VARSLHTAAYKTGSDWERPVIQTSVVSEGGIAELADALVFHREYLGSRDDAPSDADIDRSRKVVLDLAARRILDALVASKEPGRLTALATRVASGDMEPAEAADQLLKAFFATHLTGAPFRNRLEAVN
jgi:putative protein kinase ArgK-like GTPase of G3E family